MASLITPGGASRADATATFFASLPAFTPGGVARQAATADAVAGPARTAGNVFFGTPLLPNRTATTPAAAALPAPTAVTSPAPATTPALPAPAQPPVLPTLTDTQALAAPPGTNLSDRSIVSSSAPAPAGVPSYESAIDAGYKRQQSYGDTIAKAIQNYVDTGGSKDNRSYRAVHAISALPQAYGPNTAATLGESGATAAAAQVTQRDIEAAKLGFEQQKLAETPVPTGQVVNPVQPFGPPLTTYGVRVPAGGGPAATYAPAQSQLTAPAATAAPAEGSRSTSGGHPIIYRGGKWVKLGDAQ